MLESDEPGTVRFEWRHWGKFEGDFVNHEGKTFNGKGKLIELKGDAKVKLGATGLIEDIDVKFNSVEFMHAFEDEKDLKI